MASLKALNPFETESEQLFFNWWAIVHGYISLHMCGQIPGTQQKLAQHFEAAIRRFIKGIG